MINISGILDFNKGQTEISMVLRDIAPDPGISVNIFETALPFFGVKNLVHSFLNPSAQPFISSDKRFYAFAEGEIYSSPSSDTSLESLMQHFLLNRFLEWDKINGQYVFVVYDNLEKKLHIINDRFGFRQFYYYRGKDFFIFSSQVKGITRLLPAPPDFSPVGIGELILLGYHIQENTSFENIRSLLPASQLSIGRDSFEINRYWKAIYTSNNKVSTKEFAETLDKAVERQLSGTRKGMFLSGGLDSRIVAYDASKYDSSLTAFTFGDKDSMDVKYAQLISQILGLKHFILEFQPERWKSYIPMVVTQTEGEAIFHHYKSIQFHSNIKPYCDTILTGLSGETITGKYIQNDHLSAVPTEALVDFICSRFFDHPTEYVNKFFRNDYFVHIIQSIKGSISNFFLSNENKIAADILDSWHIENRHRRFVLVGPHSDRYLFNIRSPFYDYDFFDYSLKVPVHLRYKQYFYLKALWRSMPKLRGIPQQYTGKPPFPDSKTERYWNMRNKILSFWGGGTRPSQLKKHFVDFSQLLREAFTQSELLSLTCEQSYRWHKYFNMEEIRRLIVSHMNREEDHYLIICKMITLSFLETIFINNKGLFHKGNDS